MNDIISKLNTLKSVQPSEKLVVEMREEVLSKAPVFCNLEHNYSKKSIFNLNNLFASKMAVSFATILLVLTGGLSASYASKSSLPGDALYHVKIANENMILAIASEDRKAEVEIEQAGKRLEELAEISKKPSDINQGEKLKQLVANFEKKVNKAQDGLTKIEDNGKKAQIAKVINVQTEKYTEVLAVTKENLTDVVKNDVSEKFASAADSNKKVNLDSLAIRVEVMTDDDKDEITAIVKEKVEKEGELNKEEANSDEVDSTFCSDEEDSTSCSSGADSTPSDDVELTPSDGVDLSPRSNNNDSEADVIINNDNVEPDSNTSEDTEDKTEETPTIEEEKEVLINLLDNLNSGSDSGEVKGDAVKEEIAPTVEDEEVNKEEPMPITEDEETNDEEIIPVEVKKTEEST